MTRSLRVWMFALALLGALAASPGARAKPPDLPVEPNNEVLPLLAPLTPFDGVTPADHLAPSAPAPQITVHGEHADVITITPAAPMPQAITIYHPVRPAVPLSTQRTLHWCVLFGAHPLLSLMPMPESLREERHTQEMIPVAPMPEVTPHDQVDPSFNSTSAPRCNFNTLSVLLHRAVPAGYMPIDHCGVGDDALDTNTVGKPDELALRTRCACSNFWTVVVCALCPPEPEPEPIREMPHPKRECEKPDEFECPWMRCAPCDRQLAGMADLDLSRSVAANLAKLIEAEELYHKACELARHGRYADALKCMDKARALCPPSRFEEMSAELGSCMVRRVLFGHADAEADAEEQEFLPGPCPPYWDDDDCGWFSGRPQAPCCGMRCGPVPGVAQQVTGLMKACRLALGCGEYAKAQQLAREAHALDAERVAADPVVCKVHLLALKRDKGCRCCEDCDPNDCCCRPKQAAKCVQVQMLPPLPPIDPTIGVQLEKLIVEPVVVVATSKPRLEVVEEESEVSEVPKATAKPFRVRAADAGNVISADDLLRLIPGETWTELDARTNRLRVLWRVRLGGTVYRLRYDGGDLSVDLSVTPPTGGAEDCEKK
jgi:hypothetical protein